jgi:hypothetical protein
MKKQRSLAVGLLLVLSLAIPSYAAWFSDGFSDYRISNVVWEKTGVGLTTLPLIDFTNHYMCVGYDGKSTSYGTIAASGYAWKSGIATFWVKDWGACATFGVRNAGRTRALLCRNDIDNATVTVQVGTDSRRYSNPSWPASPSGTVASVIQIEWDNVVGTVKFRFYDNTSRTLAPGVLPTAWQGESTYTFTPTDEAMNIFASAYGGPNTYFEYIRAESRPAAAAPVFEPSNRYISGPTPISISCATPGAQIYYTLNGDKPTSASTLYTGPVVVNLSEMLSAVAIAPDYEYSSVTKVTFLPLYNPPVMLDDDFTNWRVSYLLWEKNNPGTTLPLIDWSLAYMCVGPDQNGGTGYKSQTKYGYAWTSGVATFWVKDWGASASFGVRTVSSSSLLTVTNEYDNATATVRVNGTPYHNLTWPAGWNGTVASIVQIEWDNVIGTVTFRFFDNTSRAVVPGVLPTTWQGESTYTFTPTGEPLYISTYSYGGPNTYFEHIRAESIPTPVAAAPVFTPGDKYITAPTSVTIASATAGAQIYYTLNGTEPSAASLSYSAPVQVNPGDTLKAIAIANGYSSSAVTSTTYIPAFDVPAVGSIEVNGSLSDWPSSAVWSQSFLPWVGSMSSTTRMKFAWNDAQNLLYVAIETDQATVGLPGGHPVVGFGTSLDQTAYLGNGATQLAFEALTGNSVRIFNEIHEYKLLSPSQTTSYIDSGIAGVQAAYSSTGSVWTYEIAIPMWTNWAIGQMTTKMNLVPDASIYVYSMMQDALNGSNGTNLSYKGNPAFANPGGLNYAAKLTLLPLAGDANKDGLVDVGDLGILAAHYGTAGTAAWADGDFNGDKAVDVGDLGILAAHYGQGSAQALNFSEDYAKAFGTTAAVDDTEDETVASSLCSGLGLPLIAALALMGLMLVKLED